MSLQPSSRHPLATSSRPTSPAVQPPPAISQPSNANANASSGYLIPSADSSLAGTPPRALSPMLTSRRRKKAVDGDPDDTLTSVGREEEYDPKRRGPQAGPSRPRGTTLDRLESFFGIDSSQEGLHNGSGLRDHSGAVKMPRDHGNGARSGSLSSASQPGTRLVLQHTVLATDTLQGIALRYKTDIPTLRKVNGLWPGDSALSRKIIWVPLDRCKEQLSVNPDAKVGVQGADGGSVTDAASSLIGLSPPSGSSVQSGLASSPLHDRTLPSTGPSDRSDVSSSGLGVTAGADSPPVVRRLPSEVLGHFPATGRSDILIAKGKTRADQWNEEVTAARPSHRLGAGPGMSGFDPGESGVEDLLQLAREARSNNEPHDSISDSSVKASMSNEINAIEESRSSVPSSSPAEEKKEWKPNVWKFGEKKRGGSLLDEAVRRDSSESSASNVASTSNASLSPRRSLRPLKLVDKSIEEWEASSAVGKTSNTLEGSQPAFSSGYEGWNDIPPLDAYAKGRVVEAYGSSGTRGSNGKRRAARANHRFFDDLAAGLPPNSGAASKWARPIGESLPTSSAPSTLRISPSKPPSSVHPVGAAGKKASLRGLLSDALRGRVALDEALAKGFEEVMNRSEGWDLPQEEMEQARRLGLLPASADGRAPGGPSRLHTLPTTATLYSDRPRISAEDARKTLGRRQSPQSLVHPSDYVSEGDLASKQIPAAPSAEQQRGRTQMEMESLDSNHQSRRNVYTASTRGNVGEERESSGNTLLTPGGGAILRKNSSRNLMNGNAANGWAAAGEGEEGRWGW